MTANEARRAWRVFLFLSLLLGSFFVFEVKPVSNTSVARCQSDVKSHCQLGVTAVLSFFFALTTRWSHMYIYQPYFG